MIRRDVKEILENVFSLVGMAEDVTCRTGISLRTLPQDDRCGLEYIEAKLLQVEGDLLDALRALKEARYALGA